MAHHIPSDTFTPPDVTRINEEVLEIRRTKVGYFVHLFWFLLILGGQTAGVRNKYGGTRR